MGRGKKDKRDGKAPKSYTFVTAESAYRPPALVKTGIVAFDAMIGGGVPRGRFVELFGPYKGGKTALAYEIARAFQDAGGRGRWTDAEHAFDGHAFKMHGGSLKTLDYDEDTDTVEEYVHKAEAWVEEHAKDRYPKIDVLDSVAQLGTKHENETDMSKRNLDKASLIYRGFRRLGGKLSRTGTTLLFINQVREKVGVFFGSPETTTGGKGPEFFATVRVRVSQGTLKKGKKVRVFKDGRQVGMHVVVRVEKNRLMPEGQETELLYLFETGFDASHGVLRLLANNGMIDERTKGSEDGREVFVYKGVVIGDEDAFVDDHPELLKAIWSKYRPENA